VKTQCEGIVDDPSSVPPEPSTTPSYVAYVESLCPKWLEYLWLPQYLALSPTHPDGRVLVIDATENELHSRWHATQDSNILNPFAFSYNRAIKTKLVMLSYEQVEDVDRKLLTMLGAFFDIDPSSVLAF